jgi:hypothetical protein
MRHSSWNTTRPKVEVCAKKAVALRLLGCEVTPLVLILVPTGFRVRWGFHRLAVEDRAGIVFSHADVRGERRSTQDFDELVGGSVRFNSVSDVFHGRDPTKPRLRVRIAARGVVPEALSRRSHFSSSVDGSSTGNGFSARVGILLRGSARKRHQPPGEQATEQC